MALPNVTINIVKDSLGGVAITDDSIMGLLLTGVAVAGKLVLDTPYTIYSVNDAIALGITSSAMPSAFQQISEFYETAPVGQELWIIVSANTVTIDNKFDPSQPICQAQVLRDAAQGKIRWLGACWTPGTGTPSTPEVRASGSVAITNAGANTDVVMITVNEGGGSPMILLAEYAVTGSPNANAIAAALYADYLLRKAAGSISYDISVLTNTLTITAPIGRGVASNSYVLAFESTGATPVTATVTALANGANAIPGTAYSGTILNGLDSLVSSAAIKAQTFANQSASLIMPLGVIIEGIGFNGHPELLADLTSMSNDRVQILLVATQNNKVGAIGLALGRKAAIPVQRKISRVKDGALPTLTGFFMDGQPVSMYANALGTMSDAGYIIFRTFPTLTGFYFNGDGTCAAPSDDLCLAPRVRTVDKALIITYNTYVQEVEDEIKVTADGKLDPVKIGELQEIINNAILLNMADNISAFSSYIDPNQNILSSPTLNIVLKITPVGYLTQIVVNLGFKNPALAA